MTAIISTQPNPQGGADSGLLGEVGTVPLPDGCSPRSRRAGLPRLLWSVRPMLTLRSFGYSTPEARSMERYRRVALSATTGGVVRLIGLLGAAVTVPLTLGYLGSERYGFWVTVTSLAAVLQFSDLGLGNGLVTTIAESPGEDGRERVRRLVSSAMALLVASGAVVLIVSLLAARFVDWPAIFDLSRSAGNEAAPAIAIFLVCLAASIPAGLITNVQNGLQEGFIANLWMAFGAAVGLAAVVLAALIEAPIPALVAAGSIPPLVALAGNALHFFWRRHPDLRPSLAAVRKETSITLLGIGSLFFVLQIAVAVGYSSDNLIIGAVRGAQEVTAYAVPFRLFMFIPLIVALFVSPLWPAYGDAIARGDTAWVRRTLSRSLTAVAAFTVPCCVLLTIAGPSIIDAWTGGQVHAGRFLLAGLALWAVLGSLGSAAAMLLNAMKVVRFQVLAAIGMAVANVTVSIALVREIGAAGAVWGTLVSYLVCIAVPYTVYIPRLLRRLQPDAVLETSSPRLRRPR